MVLRVDKEKGYIDLSKRRVSVEDVQKCDERFNKSKTVHSIMRHIGETQDVDTEVLCQQIAWPLYKKYGHAYDAFKLAIHEPGTVLIPENLPDVKSEMIELLQDNIAKRLTPQAVKIRADIEVTCFHYEGIDAIQRALLKGLEAGDEEVPVKIKLVAPPLYVMICSAMDKDKGINILNAGLEKIKESILEQKGSISVKVAPRAVSERDDKLLSTLIETLEEQNKEVDGDSDEDQDESMGNIDIAGV